MPTRTERAARSRIGWIAGGLILVNTGVAVWALAPQVPPMVSGAMIGVGAAGVACGLFTSLRG